MKSLLILYIALSYPVLFTGKPFSGNSSSCVMSPAGAAGPSGSAGFAGVLDPTGTYILTGTIKKNRIVSHYGEMRVLWLDSSRILACFYINKGYPGYESGAFMDTLSYDEDNRARYIPPADSTCTILFAFSPGSVEVMPVYNNPRSGCGFGNDVLLGAVFEKTSGNPPVIQDLSVHGVSH